MEASDRWHVLAGVETGMSECGPGVVVGDPSRLGGSSRPGRAEWCWMRRGDHVDQGVIDGPYVSSACWVVAGPVLTGLGVGGTGRQAGRGGTGSGVSINP